MLTDAESNPSARLLRGLGRGERRSASRPKVAAAATKNRAQGGESVVRKTLVHSVANRARNARTAQIQRFTEASWWWRRDDSSLLWPPRAALPQAHTLQLHGKTRIRRAHRLSKKGWDGTHAPPEEAGAAGVANPHPSWARINRRREQQSPGSETHGVSRRESAGRNTSARMNTGVIV